MARLTFLNVMHALICLLYFGSVAYGARRHDDPSVIIVGAGISGIMAARTLAKHGIDDVLILEATDRIGGRIHAVNFDGYTVELGANWVEGVGGENKNPIWTLANEYGLRTYYSNYDNLSRNTYNEDGLLLPESITKPQYDLAEASNDYSAALSKSLTVHGEEDISISTAQRLFGLIPTTPLDMAIDYYNYDYEIAEPPRVTSLKNVIPIPTFSFFGEELHFVADKRGYGYIVSQLAKDFLKHDKGTITDSRLKLQKVVTKIMYSSRGIIVETEDNSTYTAKYAIVSVSLGVLKSNLIDFRPDLPYWKIKTFYQFDMSIFTKIFLKFPRKFWPTGPGTEFFLYADSRRGYYPLWQHLETEYPGSNILFVIVTDDESRRIEQQSDDVTKGEIMEVLKKLFGEGIPDPEDILIPRWWRDRFQGGSYTNWPIGVSDADFDRMKAPIGPLYFTGEHTSARFNGYVHGAYLAGIATAQTLIDCIKERRCMEITSDQLPGKHQNMGQEGNFTSKNCIGACCVDVQQEREALRQIYLPTIDALHHALAKCQTP